MAEYEYKTVGIGNFRYDIAQNAKNLAEVINKSAEKGWEYVDHISYCDPEYSYYLIFKRPVSTPKTP
ncbi:MAG: DUF4177 domain-containing protein [Turicibacter sp.]|nr:DUF4177 domain-containing protein [Turicibacter sp.]